MKRAFPIVLGLMLFATAVSAVAHHAAAAPDRPQAVQVAEDEFCVCPTDDSALGALDSFGIGEASAGPIWKSAMSSNDAGSTNSVNMVGKSTYLLSCAKPACYKFGTATGVVPDCTKDRTLPGVVTVTGLKNLLTAGGGDGGLYTVNETITPVAFEETFENGGYTYIAAAALDAGNPACNIYTVVKNPTSL